MSILEVVYLVFNEGYAATSGPDWVRPELCEEALRLGRVLAALMPGEPEVHGLVALMEIQASRLRARVSPSGEPVLLLDQDRARWDPLAHAMAFGPGAGLAIVDPLLEEPSLRAHHLLPSVRGDLLEKLGRREEARSEYERAASLARNQRDRALLEERARRAFPAG